MHAPLHAPDLIVRPKLGGLTPFLILLTLMTMTAIGLMAWLGPRPADVVTGAGFETPPPSPPPPVDPLVLQKIDPQTARERNALVPFITGAMPSAKPFQFSGSDLDRARATDCLASALYYEAANEAVEGQRAVAQVVLNRVRHPAFPSTVCGVVYQGATRATGCQFSFSCDGAMARRPASETWARLKGLAAEALAGAVYARVGLATHYHTDWVLPYWSSKLDKITAERTHLFFKWTGWWGTPAAFRQAYRGAEPRVARMGGLSPAHATALPGETAMDLGGALAGALTLAPAAGEEVPTAGQQPAFASPAGNFLIFTVSPRVNADMLPDMAKTACGTQPYCKVMMWADAAATPAALPVSEEALATMAFSYLRNEKGAFEKALWNCTRFPRSETGQCMKTRVPVASALPVKAASAPARGMLTREEKGELIPVQRDDAPAAADPARPEEPAAAPSPLVRRRPG